MDKGARFPKLAMRCEASVVQRTRVSWRGASLRCCCCVTVPQPKQLQGAWHKRRSRSPFRWRADADRKFKRGFGAMAREVTA